MNKARRRAISFPGESGSLFKFVTKVIRFLFELPFLLVPNSCVNLLSLDASLYSDTNVSFTSMSCMSTSSFQGSFPRSLYRTNLINFCRRSISLAQRNKTSSLTANPLNRNSARDAILRFLTDAKQRLHNFLIRHDLVWDKMLLEVGKKFDVLPLCIAKIVCCHTTMIPILLTGTGGISTVISSCFATSARTRLQSTICLHASAS